MNIYVKKFGTTLTSRQIGKEAFAAFQPSLTDVSAHEHVTVDFEGVVTLSPSWADEFLTPLQQRFGNCLVLHNTKNPSVTATIQLLEEVHRTKFSIQS